MESDRCWLESLERVPDGLDGSRERSPLVWLSDGLHRVGRIGQRLVAVPGVNTGREPELFFESAVPMVRYAGAEYSVPPIDITEWGTPFGGAHQFVCLRFEDGPFFCPEHLSIRFVDGKSTTVPVELVAADLRIGVEWKRFAAWRSGLVDSYELLRGSELEGHWSDALLLQGLVDSVASRKARRALPPVIDPDAILRRPDPSGSC